MRTLFDFAVGIHFHIAIAEFFTPLVRAFDGIGRFLIHRFLLSVGFTHSSMHIGNRANAIPAARSPQRIGERVLHANCSAAKRHCNRAPQVAENERQFILHLTAGGNACKDASS
jgi:hypothetical protein